MESGARLLDEVGFVLTWGITIGTCAFAWFKGGPAERYGGAAYMLSSMGYLTLQIGTGQHAPVLLALWLDFAVAVAFLVLAVRYNSLWLGAAMVVKGLQMALHSTHLTDTNDPHFAGFNLYAVGLNLITLTTLVLLAAATWNTVRIRRRLRASHAAASAAA